MTMRELTALAKKDPGKINHASAAQGNGGHVFAELFASVAGVDLTPVHYKGTAPAMGAQGAWLGALWLTTPEQLHA